MIDFRHYKLTFPSSISWGRGNPEEYPPIHLGGDDSRYDPMEDKKPRAGQILWIRGLTRLQTQVSECVEDYNETFLLIPFQIYIFTVYFIYRNNFILSWLKF